MKKAPIPVARSLASAKDNLLYLAFDNCLQANIISKVSNGRIIIANSAACKLFGYSRRNLLAQTRAVLFDTNERSFKMMLKQRVAGGHSSAFVTAIKKTGKLFPCEITSAVFTDEDGIKKSVTTITDMTRRIQKQNKIDRNKEKAVANDTAAALAKAQTMVAENASWKKNIGIELYDVMWDWNIGTGQIFAGDSLEEVFGYRIRNNTLSLADFKACLLPSEKAGLEKRLLKILASGKKSWNDAYSFKRFDGSIASTTCRAGIVRNAKGKATHLIGAMLDISRVEELEKRLQDQDTIKMENNEMLHLAARLSFDGIWDWNILTNEFFLGEGFEDLFGYAFNNTDNASLNWMDHLHADDKEAVKEGIKKAIESDASYWEQTYRFVRADGSSAQVIGRANIIRQADGKAYRMIGAIHDLSRQKELEEQLSVEIKIKEQQITDASQEAKKTERADIGKELHDNVNQLLGASKLYIDMAKTGGADSKMYLGRSSEYTLTAIEEIRKLTKGLTSDIIENAGLCDAIKKVIADTMEIYPIEIKFSGQFFDEGLVDEKLKLTVFRIIQEQLNNILKHAQAKKVTISLLQNITSIGLIISDDGVGFDTARKQKGIGISNIKNRVAGYNGSAEFLSARGKGCTLSISFPLPAAVAERKKIS